ncbi:hypothetical protein RZS08_28755, partial [Arthrospira platensis SPKY1]|nr:hypothetical protein [Arthrospira platensis SPKY1]
MASIQIDDTTCAHGDWSLVVRQISQPVMVNGVRRGDVSVGYARVDVRIEEALFLPEERSMLQTIAERLGNVLQRRELSAAVHRRE